MSETRPFPRDDRSWGRGSLPVSWVGGLGSVLGLVLIIVFSASPHSAVALVAVFLGMAALEAASYVDAARPWLRGHRVPARTKLVQAVIMLLLFVCFAGGAAMGGAGLCGFFAGVWFCNVGAIRYARRNRALVDERVASMAQARERDLSAERAWTTQRLSSRPAPDVGALLRTMLAEDKARWLAWLAATAVAAVASVLVDSEAAFVGVVGTGLVVLAWVSRRLAGVWWTLRDYEQARTPPRRAFVALVTDPNPRVTRPLLGVWGTEPVLGAGRMPRAEAVYRCDEERDALLSDQQDLVVHEAWVDTGPRHGSRPHWVVADNGVALPHRRAVLGRWYLGSVIGASRPAPAIPLTIPAPQPAAEVGVIREETGAAGGWPRLFGWRLLALTVVGLGFALLALA